MSGLALFIIDIQNDWLPPDGAMAVKNALDVLPIVQGLLDPSKYHWDLILPSQVRLFPPLLCSRTFRPDLGLPPPPPHLLRLHPLQRTLHGPNRTQRPWNTLHPDDVVEPLRDRNEGGGD